MAMIADKVGHVRKALRSGETHGHICHWPGCTKEVPPAAWGCKSHWMRLPYWLRQKVWAAYRPTQEISKTPSRDYVAVAQEVQDWIARNVSTIERGLEYDL
jgi:hypothetical protein